MELGEFLRKADLKRVTADIYVGSYGCYRVTWWSEDWQDMGKRKTRPESLSLIPPERGCFSLPPEGMTEIYILHGDPRSVQYVSLRRIPEEDIKKLRRQLEDCLRKAGLETILAAAEAAGKNTGKFVKFPDLFEKE